MLKVLFGFNSNHVGGYHVTRMTHGVTLAWLPNIPIPAILSIPPNTGVEVILRPGENLGYFTPPHSPRHEGCRAGRGKSSEFNVKGILFRHE